MLFAVFLRAFTIPSSFPNLLSAVLEAGKNLGLANPRAKPDYDRSISKLLSSVALSHRDVILPYISLIYYTKYGV